MNTLTFADLRRALEDLHRAADPCAYLQADGVDTLNRAIVTAIPVLRHSFDLSPDLEMRRGRIWADCETVLRMQDYLAVHHDTKVRDTVDAQVARLSQQARDLLVQLRM